MTASFAGRCEAYRLSSAKSERAHVALKGRPLVPHGMPGAPVCRCVVTPEVVTAR